MKTLEFIVVDPFDESNLSRIPNEFWKIRLNKKANFRRGDVVKIKSANNKTTFRIVVFSGGKDLENKAYMNYDTMLELQIIPGNKVLISKANRYSRIFKAHKYLLDYKDRIIHNYLILLTIIGLCIAAVQTALAILS